MIEVDHQNKRKFESGSQEDIKVPIWIIIGIQQRDWQDSQNLNNDSFYRLSGTSGQCINRTEKNSVFF